MNLPYFRMYLKYLGYFERRFEEKSIKACFSKFYNKKSDSITNLYSLSSNLKFMI